MKKIIFGILIFCILTVIAVVVFSATAEDSFQHDADVVRIEDVLYWSGLIEEYKETVGEYPLQSKVSDPEEIILVRVATRQQQEYFDKNSSSYKPDLDNNAGAKFQEFSVSELVAELENGLGRDIEEHYDIQKVPTKSPNWYNYFVSEDGYLFWVTCITCKVNRATTLLMDGYTPTVNIGSSGITDGAKKLHTRNEILDLPDFKELTTWQLNKEEYVRSLQSQYFDDSKD